MPERSISLWETISASLGFSFRIGKKYRDRRIVTTNQEGLPECFKNQAKIKHIRRFLTGL